MFLDYVELGYDHILDPKGYDHILFIIALVIGYQFSAWKQILWLITAFTLGHMLTLFLSGMHIVNISADLVEKLIPITILITAISNLVKSEKNKDLGLFKYVIALLFGLIHGLGFSNFFRSLSDPKESILFPLLSFNIGVELGQILIVLIVLMFMYVMSKLEICMNYVRVVVSLLIAAEALRIIWL